MRGKMAVLLIQRNNVSSHFLQTAVIADDVIRDVKPLLPACLCRENSLCLFNRFSVARQQPSELCFFIAIDYQHSVDKIDQPGVDKAAAQL
jgi:hypothetical protein